MYSLLFWQGNCATLPTVLSGCVGVFCETRKVCKLERLLAFIPMDRRQAMAQGENLPDRTWGTALFADISGFTPLTEALVKELGRQRGAEELTQQLNSVYGTLINQVHRYRGSVITFSGDAITCWFNEDNGLRAVSCALAMQQEMVAFRQVQTPAGTAVSLAIKIGITTGPVRRFLIGDPRIQLVDVLAGATLDHMAAAEKHAEKGEIVLGPSTTASLKDLISVADWREDPETQTCFAVIHGLLTDTEASDPWPTLDTQAFQEDQLRSWVLPPVYERLQTGQGQFLAELRPAVTLFLRFSGLDYDTDDLAGSKLDAYMRWAQNVLDHHEGYMLQLTVGDKGSYLYAAFGAPIAHDDDAIRAVAAALELRTPPADFSFLANIQIGLSRGRMRTGAYGGQTRRTYGVLGDEVNTSARLMGAAQPGQVLVSAPIEETANRSYEFHFLGKIKLKGKQTAQPVWEVVGRQQLSVKRPSTFFTSPLVGRDEYLAEIVGYLDQAIGAAGQVIRVEGIAGIGKSHLMATVGGQAAQRGFQVVASACQSATRSTPYYPWRPIFRSFFNLDDEALSDDVGAATSRQIAQLETAVRHINPAWRLRLPLLGDLLSLPIPDNPVTAAFDPRLRQEALFTLAIEIVQTWAQQQPLLVMIEDVHWMDEASWGLTVALARAISRTAVSLSLVHRPAQWGSRSPIQELTNLPYHHFIVLDELPLDSATALVANRLHGQPAPLVMSLIQAQAQGNPFFIEELVDTLRESGDLFPREDGLWILSPRIFNALRDAKCLVKEQGEWLLAVNASLSAADLGIPDSIHGAVLSRIDRLPETHKLSLKVASVIGRTFDLVVLNHTHPTPPETAELHQQMGDMENRDFVRQEVVIPQTLYAFKHNTVQEVSYETLLYSQRRALHRMVANWYEQTFGDQNTLTLDSPLAPYYPLLAYHWQRAENPDKERPYAHLAGQQAAAQFANEEAIAYFNRALELTPPDDDNGRYHLLLEREAIYGLRGERDSQANDLIQLQILANQLGDIQLQAEVAFRFANYYEAISDFRTAMVAAQQAIQWAEQAGDLSQKTKGLIAWAKALWRQGSLEEARTHLDEALQIAHQTHDQAGEATSLHHMGTVFYYLGNNEAARRHLEQALAIRRSLGDLLGESFSLTNLVGVYHGLGDFAGGKICCEQALAICRTIGNRREEARSLSNLATIHHNTLGDLQTARDYFLTALALCQDLGDRQSESLINYNLSLVLYDLGHYEAAKEYSSRALAIDRAIGDKLSEGYSLTALAMALEGGGEWDMAVTMYEEAMQLRRKQGQDASAIDDLAGLARIRLNQQKTAESLQHTQEALDWIATNGTSGIEYPVRVYLTCAAVLQSTNQVERATTILQEAQTFLHTQAERISDEAIRQAYLTQVPLNKQLQERLSSVQVVK